MDPSWLPPRAGGSCQVLGPLPLVANTLPELRELGWAASKCDQPKSTLSSDLKEHSTFFRTCLHALDFVSDAARTEKWAPPMVLQVTPTALRISAASHAAWLGVLSLLKALCRGPPGERGSNPRGLAGSSRDVIQVSSGEERLGGDCKVLSTVPSFAWKDVWVSSQGHFH